MHHARATRATRSVHGALPRPPYSRAPRSFLRHETAPIDTPWPQEGQPLSKPPLLRLGPLIGASGRSPEHHGRKVSRNQLVLWRVGVLEARL